MTPPPSTFTSEQYANPYPPGIERHYWHLARNRILLRKLRSIVTEGTRALDVGCGPGIVVDHLRRAGIDCFGVDTGTPPPATAAVAPYLVLGTSAFELPSSVRNSYSLLLLMDVLEHLPEPERFLQDCLAHFPRVTHVFVTLPARMEIWSSYDEYYGHYHRYTLQGAADLMVRAGLRVMNQGYFFHTLYAVARMMLLGKAKRNLRVASPGATATAVHAMVGHIFDLEESLVSAKFPGSSLYTLCERLR